MFTYSEAFRTPLQENVKASMPPSEYYTLSQNIVLENAIFQGVGLKSD